VLCIVAAFITPGATLGFAALAFLSTTFGFSAFAIDAAATPDLQA